MIHSKDSSVNILFFLLTFSNTLGVVEGNTQRIWARWRKQQRRLCSVTRAAAWKKSRIVGVVYPKMMIFSSAHNSTLFELFFFSRQFRFFFMFEQIFVSQRVARFLAHTQQRRTIICLFSSPESASSIRSINFRSIFHHSQQQRQSVVRKFRVRGKYERENLKNEEKQRNQMITSVVLGEKCDCFFFICENVFVGETWEKSAVWRATKNPFSANIQHGSAVVVSSLTCRVAEFFLHHQLKTIFANISVNSQWNWASCEMANILWVKVIISIRSAKRKKKFFAYSRRWRKSAFSHPTPKLSLVIWLLPHWYKCGERRQRA